MPIFEQFIGKNPEKFERIVSRVEIAGLVATIVGVLLMTKKIAGGDLLLIAGLSVLSFVYFLLANAGPDVFKLQRGKLFTIALQISYGALAVTMMGILFILMRWHGGTMMLEVGCIGTVAMFLFFNYKLYFGKLEEDGHRIMINNLTVRMLPTLLAVAFLIAIYLKT